MTDDAVTVHLRAAMDADPMLAKGIARMMLTGTTGLIDMFCDAMRAIGVDEDMQRRVMLYIIARLKDAGEAER